MSPTPKSLHIVIALIALLMCVTAAAQELIVEVNVSNPAAGAFREVSGDWDPSSGKSNAPGLTSGQGTLYVDGGESASGTFSFNVPSAGIYEVAVTWSNSGNSTGVKYTVQAANGMQEILLDQNGLGTTTLQPNSNQWISLGNHALASGPNDVVTVSAVAGTGPVRADNLHRIYVDAVKITRVADLPSDMGMTLMPPTSAPTPEVTPPPVITPAPFPVVTPAPVPVVTPTPTPTQSGIVWQQNLEQARNEALSRNRPLAVFCFNHRSRLSRDVTAAVLQDAAVIAAMNGAIPVRIDLQMIPSRGRELGIYRVPTLILYAPRGQEIDRVVGDFGPSDVTELLARGH